MTHRRAKTLRLKCVPLLRTFVKGLLSHRGRFLNLQNSRNTLFINIFSSISIFRYDTTYLVKSWHSIETGGRLNVRKILRWGWRNKSSVPARRRWRRLKYSTHLRTGSARMVFTEGSPVATLRCNRTLTISEIISVHQLLQTCSTHRNLKVLKEAKHSQRTQRIRNQDKSKIIIWVSFLIVKVGTEDFIKGSKSDLLRRK